MPDPPSQPEPLTSEEIENLRIELSISAEHRRVFDATRVIATIDALTAEKERLEDHRDALIEANEWWEAKCQRIEAEKERLERENEELKAEIDRRVRGLSKDGKLLWGSAGFV